MYEIRKLAQKPQNRETMPGAYQLIAPGLKHVATVEFYYPENRHPTCEFNEGQALAAIEGFRDMLSVQDFLCSEVEGVAG